MSRRRSASTDRALGIALGALADRLVGDPRRGHPVAGLGRLAASIERAVWQPRRAVGAAYAAGVVGACALAAGWLERRAAHGSARIAVTALTTWAALGGRSLEREAAAVAKLVAAGDLDGARRRLPALVGRDPTGLGPHELCRAAIESVAENTADAVIAPLLWGTLAHSAGTAAYRAANTLDAMVGHRTPRYERFGWAAARLDDTLTWPAARLGALLAVALAPLVGGDRTAARQTLRRDGAAHPSPNAGRMEAAFAGALDVRLGGLNRYPSGAQQRPSLGNGRPPTPADVTRAVRLARLVGAASAAGLVVLTAARGR